MHEVTCLGILVADAVCWPIDEYPKRGQLALVDQISMHTGGCAANTGTALAKLGVATTIMGKVGTDPFGDFVVNALGARGLSTGSIIRDPDAQTSATAIMVQNDGERSFVHCVGANAKLRESELDFGTIEASRILHIAGTFLMPGFDGEATASVLRRAREAGVTTCLDTAWDSRGNWMKLLECCLPHLDYCVPSYEEAQQLTGRQDGARRHRPSAPGPRRRHCRHQNGRRRLLRAELNRFGAPAGLPGRRPRRDRRRRCLRCRLSHRRRQGVGLGGHSPFRQCRRGLVRHRPRRQRRHPLLRRDDGAGGYAEVVECRAATRSTPPLHRSTTSSPQGAIH